MLTSALKFFGDEDLATIGGAIRHHLNVLSNVYRRAASESVVRPGYNPVGALMDKPKGERKEANWLEVPDAALLLESARTYKPKRPDAAMPFIYPLIATYLLTGGRETEVLGLEINDVNFERRRSRSGRMAWAQDGHVAPRRATLAAVGTDPARPHQDHHERRVAARRWSALPSVRLKEQGVVTDFRKALDAVAERAGWKAGEIRSKMFRHTHCAARLQALDQGAPVSVYTGGKELGHSGDALVKRVYGQLGEVRHRSEVIEYRVVQHKAKLGARLQLLKSA